MKRNRYFAFFLVASFMFCTVLGSMQTQAVESGMVDILNDPEVTVSDAMTYEEMIAHVASRKGISIQQAMSGNAPPPEISTVGYRYVEVPLNVNSSYNPTLEMIVETTEVASTNAYYIETVFDVYLLRTAGGLTKQFQGTVLGKIADKSAWQLYYRVDGDWLNEGTTSVTATMGVDLGLQVGYSCSVTSNVYVAGYFKNNFLTMPHDPEW